MKHSLLLRTVALLATTTLALHLGGCSREERSTASAKAGEMYADASAKAKDAYADASAKAKEVYADSRSALSEAWQDAKSYTFEKRDEFRASARAMTSSMEARLRDLRADYSEAKASASRKAAMNELKDSESNYRAKLDALGNATADTWESAKQNVIAAWERLEAAYHKARAE